MLLSATTAFAQQEKLGSGIDKTNMDLTIKPGNDFYRYAAGNWMKNHPLDAEHTDNGAFTDLFEQNQKRIQDIILEYASKPQQKGSLGQKIGSLYNLRMDSVRLNKEDGHLSSQLSTALQPSRTAESISSLPLSSISVARVP